MPRYRQLYKNVNVIICFVPEEHFVGKKRIAAKAAFRRYAWCKIESLRLAQIVPTERGAL